MYYLAAGPQTIRHLLDTGAVSDDLPPTKLHLCNLILYSTARLSIENCSAEDDLPFVLRVDLPDNYTTTDACDYIGASRVEEGKSWVMLGRLNPDWIVGVVVKSEADKTKLEGYLGLKQIGIQVLPHVFKPVTASNLPQRSKRPREVETSGSGAIQSPSPAKQPRPASKNMPKPKPGLFSSLLGNILIVQPESARARPMLTPESSIGRRLSDIRRQAESNSPPASDEPYDKPTGEFMYLRGREVRADEFEPVLGDEGRQREEDERTELFESTARQLERGSPGS